MKTINQNLIPKGFSLIRDVILGPYIEAEFLASIPIFCKRRRHTQYQFIDLCFYCNRFYVRKEYVVLKFQILLNIGHLKFPIPFIFNENPCGSLPWYNPLRKEVSANKAFKKYIWLTDICISEQVLVSCSIYAIWFTEEIFLGLGINDFIVSWQSYLQYAIFGARFRYLIFLQPYTL